SLTNVQLLLDFQDGIYPTCWQISTPPPVFPQVEQWWVGNPLYLTVKRINPQVRMMLSAISTVSNFC
ncbi:MAG TPA: hypothetical protein PLL88_11120, partial [Anaerolineaceae bacterium]|nr:hypothetical protein [Anaerolineaceae bacterium]